MSNLRIPPDAVRFYSSQSPVHTARLLEWDGRLLRAVRPASAEHIQALFHEGAADRLAQRGLVVPTQVSPLQLEGYGPVLEHQRLPLVTYPFEWSAAGLQDAALAFLDLNDALAEAGLVTCDAHPWNQVFDGPRARFVDFGSFVPLRQVNGQALLADFRRWFVYPLRLMAQGRHSLARLLLHSSDQPLSDEEFARLSPAPLGKARRFARRAAAALARRLRRVTGLSAPSADSLTGNVARWRAALANMRREVADIKLTDRPSAWSHYYQDGTPRFDAPQTWNGKQRAVQQALAELRPRTLLDLGANRGFYSLLAEAQGARVLCTDIDEPCLNDAHRQARDAHRRMTATYLDLADPPASFGWGGTRFAAAADRLRCDCVLALALAHHMVFRKHVDFDMLLDNLCQFTRRDLVLEFVSPQDEYVAKWWNPGYDWYTLDNLVQQAGQRFLNVRVAPTHRAGRSLLVCHGLRAVARKPKVAAA